MGEIEKQSYMERGKEETKRHRRDRGNKMRERDKGSEQRQRKIQRYRDRGK
jgi:hypothetical protein